MADVAQSVDVDASVERVWAALTDWNRQREWMLGTRVQPTAQDGREVGGGLWAFTGIGRVGFADPMRIVDWRPPYVCAVVHTGWPVRGSASFEVRELTGGRARMTWAEHLDLPGGRVARWCWPLVKPAAVLGLRLSLRQFAAFARSYAG